MIITNSLINYMFFLPHRKNTFNKYHISHIALFWWLLKYSSIEVNVVIKERIAYTTTVSISAINNISFNTNNNYVLEKFRFNYSINNVQNPSNFYVTVNSKLIDTDDKLKEYIMQTIFDADSLNDKQIDFSHKKMHIHKLFVKYIIYKKRIIKNMKDKFLITEEPIIYLKI